MDHLKKEIIEAGLKALNYKELMNETFEHEGGTNLSVWENKEYFSIFFEVDYGGADSVTITHYHFKKSDIKAIYEMLKDEDITEELTSQFPQYKKLFSILNVFHEGLNAYLNNLLKGKI